MLFGELQLGGGAFGVLPALDHEDDIAAGEDLEVALEPGFVGAEAAEVGGIEMRTKSHISRLPDVDGGGFGAADVLLDAPVGGGVVGAGDVDEGL